MDETNNTQKVRSLKFNTEFLVALSAILVSLITLFVYIFQARIMQEQKYASVWPYIEWDMTISSEGFQIAVTNKGIGPAIIKATEWKLDGEPITGSPDYVSRLLGSADSLSIFWGTIDNRVIAAGETIEVLHIYNDVRSKLSNVYKRTSLEIKYASIYGDCWTSKGLSVVEGNCD